MVVPISVSWLYSIYSTWSASLCAASTDLWNHEQATKQAAETIQSMSRKCCRYCVYRSQGPIGSTGQFSSNLLSWIVQVFPSSQLLQLPSFFLSASWPFLGRNMGCALFPTAGAGLVPVALSVGLVFPHPLLISFHFL